MVKEVSIIPEETIVDIIYHIRGQKIMLDRDLAILYGVETKRLKEQVKRNMDRFPGHFMFELTWEEHENLRPQNATLRQGAHTKYLPYAFTEHGILMLSNVLKSSRAVAMSIKIIDVFVKLREMLLTNKDILLKLEQLEKRVTEHDEGIQMIFEAVRKLINPPQPARTKIGFRRHDED